MRSCRDTRFGADIRRLHAEVDAEYRPQFIASEDNYAAQLLILSMWGKEKEHIEKFGMRQPTLVIEGLR